MENSPMIIVLSGIVLWMALAGDARVAAEVDSLKTEMTAGIARVDVDIPTIQSIDFHGYTDDVLHMHFAIGGWRKFEGPVIDILTKRTRQQRINIVKLYNWIYRRNFLIDVRRKFDGWFYHVVAALVRTLPEYWADDLHSAIDGFGTNEPTIIQILTPLNNQEVTELKLQYSKSFNADLREDLSDDLSGPIWLLVDSQIRGIREENTDVDEAEAAKLARYLRAEGQAGNFSEYHREYCHTLTQMSYPRLRKVNEEFKKLGYSLQDAMDSVFWGWDLRAWAAVVTYADSKIEFFTNELRIALKHYFTPHDLPSIIRIITWRADIDLGNIRQAYAQYAERFNQVPLDAMLRDAASGDTLKLLLAIVGY